MVKSMNWFRLLKVQTQTQRQGFRLDDKDEDYVLEEDDDCYDKFAAMTKRVMASFPNASELQKYKGNRGEHREYAYDDFYIRVDYQLEEKGKIPDEIYCAAIEFFKSLPKLTGGYASEKKVIGDYLIAAQRRGVLYVLLLEGTKSAVRDGRVDRKVGSLMQVNLIAINRKPDNEPYSLHEEFDNWRGLF
jgi:hypothetical protein